MKIAHVLLPASWIASTLSANAGAVVVDSFDQGPGFSIVYGPTYYLDIEGPIGPERRLSVFSRVPAEITVAEFHGSQDSGAGTLSYYCEAAVLNGEPLGMQLSYSQGGPYDISDYSAFTFDFSAVTGEGEIWIYFGGASRTVIPLTTAGLLTVPLDTLKIHPSDGSFASFNHLLINFQQRSGLFSFTLDEIALVPEPAAAAGAAGLAVLLLALASRRRPSAPPRHTPDPGVATGA